MDLKFTFSLFIIYSLILSVLLESTDLAGHSDDDDDDYDYEDDTTTTSTTTTSKRPTARQIVKSPTQMYFPDLDDVRPINPCPAQCVCTKSQKLVNCTNLELTEIPRVPQDTRIIDLSHNFIGEIKPTDFADCTDIQVIDLSYNRISGLSQGTLKNIINVSKLNISHNALPKLNATTFSSMLFLKTLDLSYNPIVIPDNREIMYAQNLNELYLEGCNITHFYDNSFRQLEKLTLLNIKNNNIVEDELNIETFRPLRMLSTLKISEIAQSKTEELCKILETVDKIETTKFTISCFELMAGLNFEDSVIATKTSTTTTEKYRKRKEPKFNEQNVYSQVNNVSNEVTTPSSTTKQVSESTTVGIPLPQANGTSHENTSNSVERETAMASSDYINHILIGIIIVCCAGLVIGLICRSDVCGIKTKCCRTKRPRNENNHQTPTAEEVPLNKVVSSTT